MRWPSRRKPSEPPNHPTEEVEEATMPVPQDDAKPEDFIAAIVERARAHAATLEGEASFELTLSPEEMEWCGHPVHILPRIRDEAAGSGLDPLGTSGENLTFAVLPPGKR